MYCIDARFSFFDNQRKKTQISEGLMTKMFKCILSNRILRISSTQIYICPFNQTNNIKIITELKFRT